MKDDGTIRANEVDDPGDEMSDIGQGAGTGMGRNERRQSETDEPGDGSGSVFVLIAASFVLSGIILALCIVYLWPRFPF
jgi:hypothetical protein